MKKLFSLFAALLYAGSIFAAVVTLDPSKQTPIPNETDISLAVNGIGIDYHGTLNAANEHNQYADFRVYANNTLKLSAGSNITKVVIAGKANKQGFTLQADKGSVTQGSSYDQVTEKAELSDPLIVVENINAKSVTLTCGKQLRAYMIQVTTDGEGGGEEGGGEEGQGGGDPVIPGGAIALDVAYCDAAYFKYDGEDYWQFNFYKDYDEDTEEVTYPDLYIGAPAKSMTALAGKYAADELYFVEMDLAEGNTVEAVSASDFMITYIKPGTYHFAITFEGDDGKTYALDITLDPEVYDGETYEDITLMEYGGGEEESQDPTLKTVAEFLALKNTSDYYILSGKVENIQNTTYGNFDLKDETGSVYVYGLLTPDGEKKKFESLGIAEGDVITIKAKYAEFNGTPEVKDGIFMYKGGYVAVENTTIEIKPAKIIENGVLIIERNGVRYNTIGQIIR